MTRADLKDYINYHPQIFLKKARHGYICPICGNGEGKDGTGIQPKQKASGRVDIRCYKCNFQGDMIDLGAIASGTSKPFKGACSSAYKEYFDSSFSFYGFSPDTLQRDLLPTVKPVRTENNVNTKETVHGDFTRKIRVDQERLLNSVTGMNYLHSRGFTDDTIRRFMFGFESDVPFYKNGSMSRHPAIVIPYNRKCSYYAARAIDEKLFSKPKGSEAGIEPIYNERVLAVKDSTPVFVCESQFCAVSIMQEGGDAIALGGTGASKLISYLESVESYRKKFILCLDNDAAGREAQTLLKNQLQQLSVTVYEANIAGENKDPNEALQKNREVFSTAIKQAIHNAK